MSRTVEAIIRLKGGLAAVAEAAGVKHWAVRKWPRIGIPETHWPIFVEAGIATPDELYAANLAARGEAASPEAPREIGDDDDRLRDRGEPARA